MAETEDGVETSGRRPRRWPLRVGAAVGIVAVLLLAVLAVRNHVRAKRSATARQMLQQVCNAYAALESLEVEGKVFCDATVFDTHCDQDYNFSLKLHRSGRGCVVWCGGDPLGAAGLWQGSWFDGGQYWDEPIGGKFGPTGPDQADLLAGAHGEVGLLWRLFFPEPDAEEQPQGFFDPRLVGEDVAAGQNCNLIEGHDAHGNRQWLWLSKDGLLLVQQRTVVEQRNIWCPQISAGLAAGGLGRHAGLPGKALQKLLGKVKLWSLKRRLGPSNRGVRVSLTTVYRTVRTNSGLKATDLAFPFPTGPTLGEVLWRQIAAHQEAQREAVRQQAEAAGSVSPGPE